MHGVFEEIHEITFNVLLFILAVHIAFHVFRHFSLKDNVLKIMPPKPLHRFL